MAESLQARHVLTGEAAHGLRTYGDVARVRLAEEPYAGAITLRLDAADADAVLRLHEVLGVELPVMPNTWQAHDGISVLWQAFDEWLVLTPDGRQQDVAARLAQALVGRHAAVMDVSDLRAVFSIDGPASRDLLRKGCAVDLHPRGFNTGRLALTALARVRVVLQQTGETPSYQILVDRSYAGHLWDWLVDAAGEYICE